MTQIKTTALLLCFALTFVVLASSFHSHDGADSDAREDCGLCCVTHQIKSITVSTATTLSEPLFESVRFDAATDTVVTVLATALPRTRAPPRS